MKLLRLIGAVAGLTLLGIAGANAAPAYSTANVNVRTGPDTDFPSVGVIPEGDPLEITGCLNDESWCDVIWAGNRGWVFSEYLAFEDRGEYIPLPDVGPAAYRIPTVAFVASEYWNRYYIGRPWYADRARWFGFHVRPRAGWHAPPPGRRAPGWWRAGYSAPIGMGPPREHWRRHERREERREDRRGDRRDRWDDRR